MKTRQAQWAESYLHHARHSLAEEHLSRIVRCLQQLTEKEIWWRPNAASNSVGNLILHLQGNVRQWIISGLGGAADRRQRDREFAERGPLPRRELISRLRKTVAEASGVLGTLAPQALRKDYRIQGFRVRGLSAVANVLEHFALHTGQIVYVTKMKRGKDHGFTHLPGKNAAKERP